MKQAFRVTICLVALGLSAGLIAVACDSGAGPPTGPVPDATDPSRTSTSDLGNPSQGTANTTQRAALVKAAIQRAEQQLEAAVATWQENGVPQDEITRRTADVRAYIDEARSTGIPKVDSSRRALLMKRFREATQRAIEQGRISAERGAALIEQYEAHLDKKEYQ